MLAKVNKACNAQRSALLFSVLRVPKLLHRGYKFQGKCKSWAKVAAQKQACAQENSHSFLTLGDSWAKVVAQLQASAQEKAYCFLALCESCVKVAWNSLYPSLRSGKFNHSNDIPLFAREVKE